MAQNVFPEPSSGGIPSGNTAGRPGSPVIGDTYYNGQKGYLEIYNGTAWVVSSAVPGAPSITVSDVGTGVAFGSAQAAVVITAPTVGGAVDNYVISATNTTNSYSESSATATTVNMILGTGGSYNVSAIAVNGFGNSPASPPFVPSLTTLPQIPVISVNSATTTTITIGVAGENGGKTISNYQYSFDGTTYTAFSPAQTGSTVTFTGLTEGNVYTIRLKAVNPNGVTAASDPLTTGTSFSYDYVVVGGGAGASGYYYTGGGGSGVMRTGTLAGSPNVAQTITVGAGGAQQNGPGGNGNPGSSSVLGTITSVGGRGYAASGPLGYAGGTIATSSQGGGSGGNAGSASDTAGGGGGAGAAGTAGSSGGATGNGGVGLSTSISGSAVFYAGGGGGSSYNVGSRGSGGNGGGGNGTDGSDQSGGPAVGSAGTANTGGGGGGASHPANGPTFGYGFAGGSGRVIIKIPSAYTATFTGGVTQTNTTSGGFKIYQITAAGVSDTVTFNA